MDYLILDLSSDANVLSKQTLEYMGNPKLQWFPIRLCIANQQKLIPIGRPHGVTIDIEGTRVVADFEVIEIIDDSSPYLVLLKIGWAFIMNEITNLKNRSIAFKKNELQVIVLLDPVEGVRYIEPNCDYYEDEDIQHIYKLTVRNEYWINRTADRRINMEKGSTYQPD